MSDDDLDDTTRAICMDLVMRQVLECVREQGMIPLVLLAGSSDGRLAVLPCGPAADKAAIYALLQRVVDEWGTMS